jgi:hypothetical protein
MKSNFLFGSILAAALSVGVGAQAPAGAPQDPTSPKPSPSQSQSMTKGSSEAITVTGCIQADTAAATGTSGGASKAESFILANASAGAGGAAAGAAGTAGTAGAGAPTASEYKLSGKSEDLKKYVNSKVEIKGKVDSASAGAAAGGGPTLRVDSVKQVSPSCSQ